MSKISVLNEYIEMCNDVISKNNNEKAFDLQEVVLQKFGSEIKNLYKVIRCYRGVSDYREQNLLIDCIQNIRNIRDELESRKEELEKPPIGGYSPQQVFNISQSQNLSDSGNSTVTVRISVDQVIQQINEIPNNILSNDEKEELEDKISAVEVAKKVNDKAKISSKVGAVLKYIADKGIEVGLAVLPYIVDVLKSV